MRSGSVVRRVARRRVVVLSTWRVLRMDATHAHLVVWLSNQKDFWTSIAIGLVKVEQNVDVLWLWQVVSLIGARWREFVLSNPYEELFEAAKKKILKQQGSAPGDGAY